MVLICSHRPTKKAKAASKSGIAAGWMKSKAAGKMATATAIKASVDVKFNADAIDAPGSVQFGGLSDSDERVKVVGVNNAPKKVRQKGSKLAPLLVLSGDEEGEPQAMKVGGRFIAISVTNSHAFHGLPCSQWRKSTTTPQPHDSNSKRQTPRATARAVQLQQTSPITTSPMVPDTTGVLSSFRFFASSSVH